MVESIEIKQINTDQHNVEGKKEVKCDCCGTRLQHYISESDCLVDICKPVKNSL